MVKPYIWISVLGNLSLTSCSSERGWGLNLIHKHLTPGGVKAQISMMCQQTEVEAIMRSATFVLCILGLCALAQPVSAQTPPPKRIVIAASTILDGRGHVLRNTRIVIEGSKIVAIDRKAGPVDYDLRGLTVLPG